MPYPERAVSTGTSMAERTVETNTIYGVALNTHEVTFETTMSFLKRRMRS